ncbi:uncharacterized protein CPUR_03055 [Claviceps purpurea 20.1]|uniref:Uncharacterized protein n=1 Tax=Claviceps purpurea (strain 20.1) TaxID=1111077 RepID=M1VVE1_CLAP2|nr:uncharacterized protein CPUR_03055 [Claviceps purpurea 20.1]
MGGLMRASTVDKSNKPSTPHSKPSPVPSQSRTQPSTSQDTRNPQGTLDNKIPAPQDASPPTSSAGVGIARRLSRSGSIENKNSPAGSPPHQQRRNSWFSNISAKLSGSASSPPSTSPSAPNQHHHSLHFLHHKDSQQHGDEQGSPSPSQSPVSRPPNTEDAEPIPPKLNIARNAVLQHAAAKPEGNGPYTPAPPKSGQAGFLGVLRRLSSSSSGNSLAHAKFRNGLVERKVLNVDRHRERCKIAELKEAKLRRVAFCVDVEIAPMPRYADGETHAQTKTIDGTQKKKLSEKGEGNALKNPAASEASKEAEEAVNESGAQPGHTGDPATGTVGEVHGTCDGAADRANPSVTEKEPNKKKEKKKKSEEERKARKEKRRRAAEESGSVPIEICYDSTDSSSETRDDAAPPKPSSPVLSPSSSSASSHPTRNPARIYRRCCQLRETPILKKITEQLMDSSNANVAAGTVAKLDLTDYYLQLPDLITLGDYLAVVPVKEIILENCGLFDEGLRVILAGLLAAKLPLTSTSRRKKAKQGVVAEGCQGGGVVERLVLKNNKLGPDGWKHISLFLYKCRSLKSLDISLIPFPRQAQTQTPAGKAGGGGGVGMATLPNGVQIPRSISGVFAKAVAERLGGSTLDMVNMGETEPNTEQLGSIVDGMIKCGVRRLGLAHNSLDAEGIKHVVRYLEAGVCEGLDLGGNDLSEHIEALARSLDGNHMIWALSLANCGLTPSSLGKMLPILAKLTNFRFIDLSNNQDLFQSEPSALGLLRRYLPQMTQLKRIHLQDASMSSEQAIALVEILPEVRNLAHINILGNSELVQLANAKTEEAQEEACALYTSLMAAARISKSLVCVDIEVPGEDAGEVVKALAKQVVAYCLRNMERMPDANIATAMATGASAQQQASQTETEPTYPDVLVHLVGHDVMDPNEEIEDDKAGATEPDEDYVIGGTGVVKALACCLKNRSDDARRPSEDLTRVGLPPAAKAKDLSKHLLAGARKIRQRLQPALRRAQIEDGDEMTLRKLTFLDETLQGIINRFEDEFPDTRQETAPQGATNHGDDSTGLAKRLSGSSSSDEEPSQKHTTTTNLQDSENPPTDHAAALLLSDPEDADDADAHATKATPRSNNSTLSRELAEEEGRVLRAGHRFRAGFVGKDEFENIISTIDEIGADARHAQMLVDLADDIGGELLEKVREKGAVRAFKEDREVLWRSVRESDPDHWGKFLEAQEKARENINVGGSAVMGEGKYD